MSWKLNLQVGYFKHKVADFLYGYFSSIVYHILYLLFVLLELIPLSLVQG